MNRTMMRCVLLVFACGALGSGCKQRESWRDEQKRSAEEGKRAADEQLAAEAKSVEALRTRLKQLASADLQGDATCAKASATKAVVVERDFLVELNRRTADFESGDNWASLSSSGLGDLRALDRIDRADASRQTERNKLQRQAAMRPWKWVVLLEADKKAGPTVDAGKRGYTSGSYEGRAHLIAGNGAHHCSVNFTARNSSDVYASRDALFSTLQNNLRDNVADAVVRAFGKAGIEVELKLPRRSTTSLGVGDIVTRNAPAPRRPRK